MPPSKINKSTPGEIHQVDLVADLAEEEYLEFAGMCGKGMSDHRGYVWRHLPRFEKRDTPVRYMRTEIIFLIS